MKKRNLKNLDLKKQSISNFKIQEIKGGIIPTFTIASCWSCLSCPTIDCFE